LVTDAREHLTTLRDRLSALASIPFDVALYNAGMDMDERCQIGGLAGITRAILAEREQIVFEWARLQKVPVAFVLAGDYEGGRLLRKALVGLHRLTVAAAALAKLRRDAHGGQHLRFQFRWSRFWAPQAMRTRTAGTQLICAALV
jgi:hypothetical protein